MGLLVDGRYGIAGGRSSADLDDVLAFRLEVYQAQGMLTVDLGVSITEAMARLRACAYAEGRVLSEVAKDVVEGKLKLDRDTP
jgi:AmiR/NasT family two-component response regulator